MKTNILHGHISLNASQKCFRQNQNTHFMFNNFFFPENRALYKITWKNVVQPERPRVTIQNGAWALNAV